MDTKGFSYDLSTVGFLAILLQVVFPILVAVITKTSSSPRVKAVVLMALTAVSGVVQQALSVGLDDFNVKFYVLNGIVGFVVSVATYFGFWKPTGSAALAGRIGPQ